MDDLAVMIREIAYCHHAECGERRIPTFASLLFAVIGASAFCGAFLWQGLSAAPDGFEAHLIPWIVGVAVGVVIVTGAFAAYEKFRHPLLAFIFGVSLPGLLAGLAMIAASSAPGS